MNDIEMLIKRLEYIEESYLDNHYMSIGNFKDIDEAIKILKEKQLDKAKIMHYEKLITNGLASKEITKLNEELLAEVQTNYIPKSLIKEKIEELKEELERDRICIDFVIEHKRDIELIAKIDILEELLNTKM